MRNDPVQRIDPTGLDYYITIGPGASGVKHRFMVGDDGAGNHYIIDFAPDTDKTFSLHRLCGVGVFKYSPGIGKASESLDSYQGIDRSVVTTPEEDRKLAAAAKGLDQTKMAYCLLANDCRAVDRTVKATAAAAEASKWLGEWVKGVLAP